MAHLDASIQMFRHGYDVTSIRPKNRYNKNPYIKRGSYVRVALDAMRDSTKPLPVREICQIVLHKHSIPNPDEKIVNRMVRNMEACLMRKVKEGVLSVDRNCHPKCFYKRSAA